MQDLWTASKKLSDSIFVLESVVVGEKGSNPRMPATDK